MGTPQVSVGLRLVEQEPERLVFEATLRNEGREAVHVWDGPRMPYVTVESATAIRIARSLPELPADRSLYGVTIPPTASVAAGAERKETIVIALPVQETGHFERPHAPATPVAGRVSARFEVGLSPRAIPAGQRAGVGYRQAVSEQVRVVSDAITLDL